MSMIDLCTLGTGGSLPMPDRGLSSLYVRVNGRLLLVDCGEGTQTAVRRLGWGFVTVDHILITHFHADHCGGLPGFLLSIAKTPRTEPVHIWGPVGLKAVVAGLRVICPQLPFQVIVHELTPGETFSAIGLEINCFALDHGMPCLGYRFDLHRPAAFSPEKAQALNVPQSMWKLLQQGQDVTVDGCTVTRQQVSGEPRRGLSFLYCTDTRPVGAIAQYGYETDLMFLEGMYGSDDKMPQAKKNHHSLYRESAALARDAGTKALALTHFSTCIEDPEEFLPLAQEVFPDTFCAQDLMTWTLRFPQR